MTRRSALSPEPKPPRSRIPQPLLNNCMPDRRVISAASAIREALDIALSSRDDTYLMGEGVADPGGIFGTTKGLIDAYGPERVVEMPVSENGMTGIAVGSALMGRRPIMTHQRVDFALLCL